jgi:hypothetical protein
LADNFVITWGLVTLVRTWMPNSRTFQAITRLPKMLEPCSTKPVAMADKSVLGMVVFFFSG